MAAGCTARAAWTGRPCWARTPGWRSRSSGSARPGRRSFGPRPAPPVNLLVQIAADLAQHRNVVVPHALAGPDRLRDQVPFPGLLDQLGVAGDDDVAAGRERGGERVVDPRQGGVGAVAAVVDVGPSDEHVDPAVQL